ncbi:MAG TPA: SMC-Scp complex subunit ScpB [Candidatus Angelobacter sp.]|jgi:segregation and condensation protein B|nr:SMC-Scp complex subunit ScpB [Candidatus Angelobacter sp.]
MSIKSKLEALIYAAEEPIGIDQMAGLLRHDLLALQNQPAQPDTEAPENHLGVVEVERSEAVASSAEQIEDGQNVQVSDEQSVPPDSHHALETPRSLAKKTGKGSPDKSEKATLRNLLRPVLEELISEFAKEDHGIEIRQVAGGYRMSTKPEHHDVVRAFAKSLKPPIRLSLQALETLAVIAYKQPITVPEISDIRGVDSAGVIGTLLERKLITTAGRKPVVGRPMLYKTTKDFLVRFGLSNLDELPSIEEFEKLAAGDLQEELFSARDASLPDATGVPDIPESNPEEPEDSGLEQMAEDRVAVPQNITEPTVSSDPNHGSSDDEATNQIASESTGG